MSPAERELAGMEAERTYWERRGPEAESPDPKPYRDLNDPYADAREYVDAKDGDECGETEFCDECGLIHGPDEPCGDPSERAEAKREAME